MAQLYLAMGIIGAFIICFSLVSAFIKEKLFLSEALVATLFGIALGPEGLHLFSWSAKENPEIIYEFSR
jgi:NhaP-type Na+/H+ or K+/H+ antiporter